MTALGGAPMPEQPVAPSHASEWRRGWSIVVTAMIGIGTGAALYQYLASLFITSLETTYGWSRGQVVTIGALALVGAFSSPFMGRIADRYGIRPVAIVATLVIAIAYVGLAASDGSMGQIIPLMMLFGLAAPGTVGIVYSRAIASWFHTHRGMALGLMSSGISLGALLLNAPVGWLIETHGFRAGYLALAGLALFVGLPVIWRGLRLDPEEGQRAAPNEAVAAIDTDPLSVATAAQITPPLTTPILAIFAMPRFWLLVITMMLFNIPSAGILTQLAPLLSGRGVTLAQGSALFALFAGSVIAGRLLVGWLFDRYSPPHIAAVVTFAAAFGILSFLDTAPLVTLIPGVIAVGLVQGSESDVVAYFIGRIFAPHSFSTVYGLTMTFTMTGTAIGVIGFGRLFDFYGDYDVPLMIGAGFFFLTSGLYLTLLRYFRSATPVE